jgi:hypothetical protein
MMHNVAPSRTRVPLIIDYYIAMAFFYNVMIDGMGENKQSRAVQAQL